MRQSCRDTTGTPPPKGWARAMSRPGESNLAATGLRAAEPDRAKAESVLILTPVKNATPYLDRYWAGLGSLTYPTSSISLGLLESDSTDGTFDRIAERLEVLRARYARV